MKEKKGTLFVHESKTSVPLEQGNLCESWGVNLSKDVFPEGKSMPATSVHILDHTAVKTQWYLLQSDQQARVLSSHHNHVAAVSTPRSQSNAQVAPRPQLQLRLHPKLWRRFGVGVLEWFLSL